MSAKIPSPSQTKGVRDKGPKEHTSHLTERVGDIMRIASKKVISTQPSNTIKNTATLMRENDVRRLPIIHGGSGRLEGIVSAVDLLDFLGGGPKYNIIERDYGGNFLAAVNCHVSKIMAASQYLPKTASVEDALDIMLNRRASCIPIVESEDKLDVVALVTERDVLPLDDPDGMGVQVRSVMKTRPITASKGMMLSDVSKIMVRNRLRRLPVVGEDELLGIVTVSDVLGYLSEGVYKGADAEQNLSTRVDEIMGKNIITVSPEDDLGKVLKLVKETGYGGFPVIEDDRLFGIVTITDILRWVNRQT
jgi:CBS domain-containing protein